MTMHVYEAFDQKQLHIDKTSSLEKGIEVFPSIYIEGAAASGKTTAVRMLLSKHPEVRYGLFDFEKEELTEQDWMDLCNEMTQDPFWVIFENVHKIDREDSIKNLCQLIRELPKAGRVILLSRECPKEKMLDLIWKNQMELIGQEALALTQEEVELLVRNSESQINPQLLYQETGGWAGCVSVMIRLSRQEKDVRTVRHFYEVDHYIEHEIIKKLSKEEQRIIHIAAYVPWMSYEMCIKLWGMEDWLSSLHSLERKGILIRQNGRNRWYIAPLFKKEKTESLIMLEEIGSWYEEEGHFSEAEQLFKQSAAPKQYYDFLCRHYEKASFLQIEMELYEEKEARTAEILYLQGVQAYQKQNYSRLNKLIQTVENLSCQTEEQEDKRREIYLNLQYLNPHCSLEQWLDILKETASQGGKQQLYIMLGSGCTFLNGVRDLSGMFSCVSKEENKRARLWKDSLGEKEWIGYCLARYDYYLETKREDAIKEEDQQILNQMIHSNLKYIAKHDPEKWRFRLAAFYLLHKRTKDEEQTDLIEDLNELKDFLQKEYNPICRKNAEAILSLYSLWEGEPEHLSKWMRHMDNQVGAAITENNYIQMFCLAKGYLNYQYYEKAETILKKSLVFLKKTSHFRFYAEAIFQMGLIEWNKGQSGHAIRNVVESFVISNTARYVKFYTDYGKKGYELLSAYVDWMKQNTPENWNRKKKYNYGSVLRMPVEDYVEVVLRAAKKKAKSQADAKSLLGGERLTMMETIILQDISRGLSNAEICEEQKLKMPTVKSHLYSLYKKLGVNSRVQAINKGKEMGIVR